MFQPVVLNLVFVDWLATLINAQCLQRLYSIEKGKQLFALTPRCIFRMCILILIFISCAVSSVSPYRSNELYVTNGGDYGSWSYYSQCPEGAYGIGYSMKVQNPWLK